MITILMMSEKMVTLGLLKTKVFWNKGYGAIMSFCDITNKILSQVSNYVVNVIMWLKFGYSSISMTEVIRTSVLKGFD